MVSMANLVMPVIENLERLLSEIDTHYFYMHPKKKKYLDIYMT